MSNTLHYVVYFDRIPHDAIVLLMGIVGCGRSDWTNRKIQSLPEEKRIEFGKIATGKDVKNVRIELAVDIYTGWKMPMIVAEPV